MIKVITTASDEGSSQMAGAADTGSPYGNLARALCAVERVHFRNQTPAPSRDTRVETVICPCCGAEFSNPVLK